MRRGGSWDEPGEASIPPKGLIKLAEQQEQEIAEETELAAITANEFRCMHTLSAALGQLDARPARLTC